jgi:hypothetical protein
MSSTSALVQNQQRHLQASRENWTYAGDQAALLGHWSWQHAQAIARNQIDAARETAMALSMLAPQFLVPNAADAFSEYAKDCAQRWILFSTRFASAARR